MNWVDALTLVIVILLLLSVIFYQRVYPWIKKRKKQRKTNATSCPHCGASSRTAKRLIRDYRYEKKKEEKKRQNEKKTD